MSTTIWILGDQLSLGNAALLQGKKSQDRILMIESPRALKKLTYHKHRLILILSASRHFSSELKTLGWNVDYYSYEAQETWESALSTHLKRHGSERILVAQPNNYDEHCAVEKLAKKFPIEIIPTTQFLLSRDEFQSWASGKKSLLMESHYRRIREKYGYLMDKRGNPIQGQWNFDPENRKTYRDWEKAGRPRSQISLPKPDAITRGVIRLIDQEFSENPGNSDKFWLPVSRQEALKWLENFISTRLSEFGPWEDLMVDEDPLLFHSVLSPLLNIGLLTPQECIESAIDCFRKGNAPINSVEGFVRQIAGWREFVNGVYWLKMPEYEKVNGLQADLPLPDFFYSGKTDLNCVRKALNQVHSTGFNHHIQRLMILGNFLLIAGVHPQQALRWFNEMYVDAHDWVMAANVLGMVLHADGGFMATKPYAAGSGYISKMSNYCSGCRYKPGVKTGPSACPLNYLYWNFYSRNLERFKKNPRVGMAVITWNKKSSQEKNEIKSSAETFLLSIQKSSNSKANRS
ncbi:MAG: cryptochrome/photolyase family protein [Bdellovibrionales bacterium]|nr:cryptochrome/photolyase family protein [Bdellovibrionales bacterium]